MKRIKELGHLPSSFFVLCIYKKCLKSVVVLCTLWEVCECFFMVN